MEALSTQQPSQNRKNNRTEVQSLVGPVFQQKADQYLFYILTKIYKTCLKKHIFQHRTHAKAVIFLINGRDGHTKATD